MSILEGLGLNADTLAAIAQGDPRIRDDLRIIPEAEAAGWAVSFRDGSWHNPAQFKRDGASVWQVSAFWGPPRLGWNRTVRRADGTYVRELEVGALRDALGLPGR